MRRIAAAVALGVAGLVLGGCVYDPYTGTYQPCCAYGYPSYGYPSYGYPSYGYRAPSPYYGAYGYQQAPYGYQQAPYGAPPPAQPAGGYPDPAAGGTPGYPGAGGVLEQRFAAANVTRDGRLTREQAAAGMPFVAQNFHAIDFDQKGYVTLPEVRAFAARRGGEWMQGGQPNPW